MEASKLQIILHAEYLGLFKTAATAHRINGLIAKIYGFCYLGREKEALRVLEELDQLVVRSATAPLKKEHFPQQ
ncbi:MAG: hypothetical protein D6715_05035 [Calditrichaeota bacterium]|nr:MAG: hypothetical protein D6715_05035 [Calditrichota bacterium]